ncbi:NAD-dependent epimerase/dehydratase family protein [Parapedobacter tibetensis]|uniref:NAD-dependent epimerase/dehydratase family protein n=1 Tax=Parapedobacter tibetensis TaxID=2972951 RepID=UPI00214DDEC7|nr:NAD-dependent epimerase/dehydratase family protein [Parapedobacter tibetensis]
MKSPFITLLLEALYQLYIVVLVTGGTGFLGAVLIRRLIDSGIDVRATKRISSTVPASLSGLARLQWVNADINDFFALEDAFQGVTKVYHCAAMISYQKADRKRMTKVNVDGTANVVTLATERQVRLLHVSSIAAVGRGKDGRETTEDDLWEFSKDQSGYAIVKYEAEMEVWRGIAEGLDAVIVNPALIIGPTAGTEGSGSVFSLLHRGLKFYTGGSVGLIDVEDVAKAMVALMADTSISGARYLLSNVNMTHKELLEKCSVYLNRPAPHIQATPFMLGVAWRAAKLMAAFTGKTPLLTKESAKASNRKMRFSNKKIVDAIGITFKPIDNTLREICAALINS